MKEQDFRFMPMMKPPCTSCPMHQAAMQDEMEGMYPQIYMLIYPHIKHHCHMMELKHGHMHHYKREEIEEICEDIMKLCEKDINDYYNNGEAVEIEHEQEHSHDHNHRKYRQVRRNLASDLVKILVLRELLQRRQHQHHHHPYYGYMPPHPGYMAPPHHGNMPPPYRRGMPYGYNGGFEYFEE